jgi:predicted helicase
MAMWGIATLLGEKWDFSLFRQKYYTEVRLGGTRRIWLPKKDELTKQRLAELVKRYGYTGSISDFTDVPDQIDKTVEIELSKAQKEAMTELSFSEADALVRASRMRTIENGVLYGKKVEAIGGKTDQMSNETKIFKSHKIDYILERAIEFPKLLVFANFTAQILEIEKALKEEGYNVSTLTGQTKDRTFLKGIDESDKPHIVIAQSSVSSGWELSSFPCVIFASLSWRVVDHIQARGRVLRMNKIKKNLYIYLVVKGGKDEACYKSIMSGQDFQERLTLNI